MRYKYEHVHYLGYNDEVVKSSGREKETKP